jgi:CheY-like chemotaxis protein/HPt (histidine-containing phosphotransfer) domain-containing protein
LIQREALASWGMETDEFSDPRAALEALSGNPGKHGRLYSMAIVDSQTPQLDGFETALRLHGIMADLPIIMLKSDARPGDSARQLQAGISGCAVKPVKRADLLRLICHALRGSVGPSPAAPERAAPHRLPAPEGVTAEQKALSILIAEDSSDNRIVLQAYLKTSPHRLTFVENGKAAVERFAAEDFDLVFMDVQMPVMDGLEATRTIRTFERKRGPRMTPIVAVTANVRPADLEKCLAAGCTSYLSKPISKRNVLNAIAEYSERPGSPSEPIHIEIPEGFEEFVPAYLEALRLEYSEMLTMLASSDFDRVRVLAHQMKGNGGSYGFASLTEIGDVLEQSAKQSDHAAVQANLGRLGDYLGRVRLPM